MGISEKSQNISDRLRKEKLQMTHADLGSLSHVLVRSVSWSWRVMVLQELDVVVDQQQGRDAGDDEQVSPQDDALREPAVFVSVWSAN